MLSQKMFVISLYISGADPASELDRCTIRLLKDHHTFSSSKCPRDGGGGAFLHFMNLFLLLSLVFYVIQSFNSA